MKTWIRAVLSAVVTAGVALTWAGPARGDGSEATWAAAGTMSIGRADAAATVLGDGRVLVTGGAVDDTPDDSASSYPGEAITERADIYDPQTGTWRAAAQMPTPRKNHRSTLLPDGRVLITDGIQYLDRQYTPTQYIYDPPTNSWDQAPGFAPSGAVVALPDGRVLADDGYRAVTYSPADGSWTNLGSYNSSDTGYYGMTATRLLDDTVLFTHADGGALRVDPAAGTLAVIPKLAMPYSGVTARTATLLSDGTVLLAGGLGFTDSLEPARPVADVERFEPATNAWLAAADLPSPRMAPIGARLADGKVLIAGGQADPFWTGSDTFVYDPLADAWATGAALPGSGWGYRLGPVGAELADGSILLAGGWGQDGYLPSALRFIVDADAPVVAFGPGSGIRPLVRQNVGGTAADRTSGVASVTLRGTPVANTAAYTFEYAATLECDASGQSCTWDAGSPIPSGVWRVEAIVADRTGNTASASRTIVGQPV